MRRTLKKIGRQLPLFIAYLILSSILIGWLFTFATDTARTKKVVIYIDAPQVDELALDLYLEEELPEGIKMVRTHPFSYALIDMAQIENADIYIVRRSNIEKYADSFLKIPEGRIAQEF